MRERAFKAGQSGAIEEKNFAEEADRQTWRNGKNQCKYIDSVNWHFFFNVERHILVNKQNIMISR